MIIFTLISSLFFFQFEFIFLPLEKISTHELPSKIKYFSMVSAPSLRGELKMFWKHPKGDPENFKIIGGNFLEGAGTVETEILTEFSKNFNLENI